MSFSYLTRFCCLFLFLGYGKPILADSIKVAGSDFLGAALGLQRGSAQKLGEHLVSYDLTGSQIGLMKVRDGLADAAFVLQTADGHPALDDLTAVPIGFWGVYFAVEESNPLNEVSMETLSEVMRKTRDGLKSEWGTLIPNAPKWTNRIVFLSFDIKHGDPALPVLTNAFFNKEVPQNFASLGEKIENPYLAGASNLVVMSRLPEPGKGLRSLAVVVPGQSVGFPPSAESMHYGDYPLRMVLYLVARDFRATKMKAYLATFLSGNQLETLEKSGLVQVPQNVRKQALLEFDLEF